MTKTVTVHGGRTVGSKVYVGPYTSVGDNVVIEKALSCINL